MQVKVIQALLLFAICYGCNNAGKDSIEKADSANEAKLDTGLRRNEIVIDENSSTFVVRAANSGMEKIQIAKHMELNGSRDDIKSFAAMMYRDHLDINQVIYQIAALKNITLPATISPEKQTALNKIKALSGAELDKEFIKLVISNYETSVDLFEKAIIGTKDLEVRAFADSTLPIFQRHLAKATTLKKE